MTMAQAILPYVFIITGLLVFLQAYPGIRKKTIGRLQASDILPVIKVTPENRELLRGAGKNLSLAVTGTFFMLFGILLIIFNK
ncbi:MAG: hypothetical protein Q8N81_06500 [bacterium]|nr:hypothetical protein [bacterium]